MREAEGGGGEEASARGPEKTDVEGLRGVEESTRRASTTATHVAQRTGLRRHKARGRDGVKAIVWEHRATGKLMSVVDATSAGGSGHGSGIRGRCGGKRCGGNLEGAHGAAVS
jgi:hypothetical protein